MTPRGRRLSQAARDAGALTSLLFLSALSLAPLLLGLSQPVGGDRTEFFYGLMGWYRDTLRAGEWPWWNGRWGLGFPGLAESQVGALYPPHVLLYSLLDLIDAFRWDYVLHRLALPVGAYTSVRSLGLRPRGAWIAALVVTFGGFAMGHRPHQWAYESLVWLPPAVALSAACWSRTWLAGVALLPWVVALQLFVGHFQIAFITALLISLDNFARLFLPALRSNKEFRSFRQRLGRWALAQGLMILGFALASVQLAPTHELLGYLRSVNPMSTDRGFLSTHALPPWKIVGLTLPGLYQTDPLWRDAMWTPSRSSPEECWLYIGLLPLGMALMAARVGYRRAFVIRWTLIGAVFFWLSLGPSLPGFGLLTGLPGFGYFRSWARFSLGWQWSLALLAGWMADRLRTPARWRSAARTALVIAIVSMTATGLFWMIADEAASQARLVNMPRVMNLCECLGLGPDFLDRLTAPRSADQSTWSRWIELGRDHRSTRLVDCWWEILTWEIAPSLWLMPLLGLAIFASSRARRTASAKWLGFRMIGPMTLILCLFDFYHFTRMAPAETVPLAELVPNGPTITALGQLPRESRVLANGRNLLMAWGLSPLHAFRTLDLKTPGSVAEAIAVLGQDPLARLSSPGAPLLGIEAVVVGPYFLPKERTPQAHPQVTSYADGQLDRWLHQSPIPFEQSRWTVKWYSPWTEIVTRPRVAASLVVKKDQLRPNEKGTGWSGLEERDSVDAVGTAELVDRGVQRRTWRVTTREPAIVVLGEAFVPGWTGALRPVGTAGSNTDRSGPSDPTRRDSVETGPSTRALSSVDDYWQAIEIPLPGEYELVTEYRPPGWREGKWLSGFASLIWLAWVVVGAILHGRGKRMAAR